jgi:hypothetical protein
VFSVGIISNAAIMGNSIALRLIVAVLVTSAAGAQESQKSDLEQVMAEAVKSAIDNLVFYNKSQSCLEVS